MKRQRLCSNFSLLIAALAAITSAAGLYIPAFYGIAPDPVWKAADIIILFIAVPLLLSAIYFAVKGSSRGMLVWLGVLFYIIYHCCFHLFSFPLDLFFGLYAFMIILSVIVPVFVSTLIYHRNFLGVFPQSLPNRYLSLILLIVALGMFFSRMSTITANVISFPRFSEKSTGIYSIRFILDLVMVVPVCGAAAWLLLRKRLIGLIIGLIAFVTCFLWGITEMLCQGLPVNFELRDPDRIDVFLAFCTYTCMTGIIGGVLLLRNIPKKIYLFYPIEKCGFGSEELSERDEHITTEQT